MPTCTALKKVCAKLISSKDGNPYVRRAFVWYYYCEKMFSKLNLLNYFPFDSASSKSRGELESEMMPPPPHAVRKGIRYTYSFLTVSVENICYRRIPIYSISISSSDIVFLKVCMS